MAELISDAHAKCFFAFEQLLKSLQHPVRDFQGQISTKEIRDEFDKYKIWAGNVGAAHSGKRYEISLDYRLREASFFKNQVLKLLKTLDDKLASAIGLIRDERKPFEEQVEESDSEVSVSSISGAEITKEEEEESDDSPWEISSDSSSGRSPQSKQGQKPLGQYGASGALVEPASAATSKAVPPGGVLHLGIAPNTEMPRLVESIKFTIACLYRIPIRKPAPLDRLKHKTSLDSSCYQHFDVSYVKDKFPNLHPDAVVRLGKMITRRRQILYYREAHKQSLDVARVQPKVAPTPAPVPSTFPIESSNVASIEASSDIAPSRLALSQAASSHFTLRSKATTARPGNISFTETQEHADLSALYAPSLAESKSSMASSYAGKDLRIDVPPRPMNDDGQEMEWFECPYCFLTKNISNKRKWKKHIFEDLQPYVCTYGDCDLYDHFFENRDAWFKHEAQHHRAKWFCNTEFHPEYESETDFLMHMRVDHDQNFVEVQFNLVKDMFRQPSKSTEGVCNLCTRSSKHLKNHVSRHLQQIALFSLPRANETSGSGKAERDSQSSISRKNLDPESKSLGSSHSSTTNSESGHLVPQIVDDKEGPSEKPDIDDHFDTAEDIPDAIDQGWDDVTDKFSKARTHTFRPLDILVFEPESPARAEIETILRTLNCSPIDSGVEAWAYEAILDHHGSQTSDAILLGPSCPGFIVELILRWGYLSSRDHSNVKVMIARKGKELYSDREISYGNAALINPASSQDYESALEALCDWAPPPLGWKPEPLVLGTDGFSSLPLKVLMSGFQQHILSDLEQLLRQLHCVPTTVLADEDEFFKALSAAKYDIILVEFVSSDEFDWAIKIGQALAFSRESQPHVPIITVFEKKPSNRTLDEVELYYEEFVVIRTPQTLAKLCDILRTHCSWDPQLTRTSSSRINDSSSAEDWVPEDPLPDPESFMSEYILAKFHLPEVVTDRLARHMTARKARIRFMQLDTWPGFGKEKTLYLSSYKTTLEERDNTPFKELKHCRRCLDLIEQYIDPLEECSDCKEVIANPILSPMEDTENKLYCWSFVSFQITDLASDIHRVWCPYCNMQIQILDDTGENLFEERWRQHILDDLKPFVCPVEKCSLPHMRWGNVHEWMKHMQGEDIDLNSKFCALCEQLCQNHVHHLANHLLELAALNVSIELVTGGELQDDEVKTDAAYMECTIARRVRLAILDDDAIDQMYEDFEQPAPIPDLSYKLYRHTVNSQPEGETKEQQKNPVLGPYRFTYEQLGNSHGVIEKTNIPDNRQSKIYFNFTCPLPGTFVISIHYKGRNRALLELDTQLDDLLEMQKNDQAISLDYVQFNVSTLLALLNRLHFIERDTTGWAFLGGWGLHDYFLELDPDELLFYGFPVTENNESLSQQSAEPETQTKLNQPEQYVPYQEDFNTYLWPLLQKQLDVLKWLLLELSAEDSHHGDEYFHLQYRLSRLLNHIKLSELPYLKWDTFDNIVEDHVFCSALGKGLGRSNESASESASGYAVGSVFEGTLHQLLKSAKDECEDIPIFRVGDVLRDGDIDKSITERQYAFSMGWLYCYSEGEWIEEQTLQSLTLVSPSTTFYSEAEIYSVEAFLPYPCRLSNWCVLNFESKAARGKHETWTPSKCVKDLNPQNRDRSVQLAVNPGFKRRFGPFCRHSNCTEHFVHLEARDVHEKDCPYGKLADAPSEQELDAVT